jgi:hypothetical protein
LAKYARLVSSASKGAVTDLNLGWVYATDLDWWIDRAS